MKAGRYVVFTAAASLMAGGIAGNRLAAHQVAAENAATQCYGQGLMDGVEFSKSNIATRDDAAMRAAIDSRLRTIRVQIMKSGNCTALTQQ